MSRKVLIKLFEQISPVRKNILSLLCIHFAPITRTTLLDSIRQQGLTNENKRAFTHAQLKPVIDHWLENGLLYEVDRRIVCSDSLINIVCELALEQGTFESLATIVQSVNPVIAFGHRHFHDEYPHVIRDLRIALYLGNLTDFSRHLASAREQYPEADVLGDLYTSLASSNYQADWFKRLPVEIRIDFFSVLIRTALFQLESAENAIVELEKLYQQVPDLHTDVIADYWLLKGNSTQARQAIGHANRDTQHLQLAWADLADARDQQALTHYQQAYDALTGMTRKRNIYFDSLAGLFATAALLKGAKSETLKNLQQKLQKGIRQKDNPFQPLIESFYQLTRQLLGQDDVQDFAPWHLHYSHLPVLMLLELLVFHWAGKVEAEQILPPLNSIAKRAEEQNYDWIAAETRAFILRLEGQSAPENSRFLVDLIQPQQDWERALNALTLLGQTQEPDEQEKNQPASRLVWLLDWQRYSHELLIEPREQKMTAKGKWTKGRAVALKRLAENLDDLPFLTDQDRQVCQLITRAHDWHYGYSRESWDLDNERALPLLSGHPLLFLKDSPSTPARLETVTPELSIIRDGDELQLNLIPEINPEARLSVTRQSPEHFLIVEVDDNQRRIAGIIGEGLRIPQQAEQNIRDAISNIAPMLTIHSDIEGIAGQIEEIETEHRPCLHILPLNRGLSFELFAHPFGVDGPGFMPAQGARSVITEIQGKRVHAQRDLQREKENYRNFMDQCPSLANYQVDTFKWETDDTESSLEILSEIKSQENHIILVWPQGEQFRLRSQHGTGHMRLQLAQKGEWFEAEGELQIDEKLTLSLQQLLQLTQSSQGRFIELGDGEFIALTKNLKKQLDELRAYTDNSDDKTRFHGLLSEAIDDIGQQFGTFETDGHWKERIERLKNIRPQDFELPSTLQAELRDYQEEGFKWLAALAEWGAGACLADDMGLGKTIQSLALILLRAADGPTLVIAPTSVCMNWQEECQRFAPTLKPILFGGNKRQQLIDEAGPFDVLISSYGLMQQEIDQFVEKNWHTLILDEAQAIKNPATKRTRAANRLPADFKIALSGTPIENHLGELWSLFRFINPGLLGSQDVFNRKFAVPIELNQDTQARNRLKKLIQPFILRRLKSEVLEELPPRTEITLHIELSKEEIAFYEALRRQALEQFDNEDQPAGEKQRFQVLAEITRLRQACCNPNLVAPELKLPSAKLETFLSIVDELLENNHKALVFSQFVKHLALVREALDKKGITYQYLDGSTTASQRRERIQAFQAGKGELFLISLKAGGTGLNLTAADYVIHMDPWWNPAVEDQASDRAHRIGQQRPVTIYRLVTKATIEDKIVELHQHKRDLADSLLEGTDSSKRMSTEDILALLKD